MSTHGYLGTYTDQANGRIRTSYIHFDGYPSVVLPELAAIWQHTCCCDTARFLDTLLSRTGWDYLNHQMDASALTELALVSRDDQAVDGVGLLLPFPEEPESARIHTPAQVANLDGDFFYLIGRDPDRIAVYSNFFDLNNPDFTRLLQPTEHAPDNRGDRA